MKCSVNINKQYNSKQNYCLSFQTIHVCNLNLTTQGLDCLTSIVNEFKIELVEIKHQVVSDSVCIDQLEILIIKNQQTLQFINRYCCAMASSNLSKAALIPFLIFVARPGCKVLSYYLVSLLMTSLEQTSTKFLSFQKYLK